MYVNTIPFYYLQTFAALLNDYVCRYRFALAWEIGILSVFDTTTKVEIKFRYQGLDNTLKDGKEVKDTNIL